LIEPWNAPLRISRRSAAGTSVPRQPIVLGSELTQQSLSELRKRQPPSTSQRTDIMLIVVEVL
jgi:hypothetical protein